MMTERNSIGDLPRNRMLAEMSMWSADLGHLSHEIARMEPYADIFHLDVADGHFSPALLLFPDLVAMIRKHTKKTLHVHLMTADDILEDQIRQFAEAGADIISVHAENRNADSALELIASLGLQSGVVLQLHTPVSAAQPFLDRIVMLTLLGTRIGIKGQGLDPQALIRLREARALVAVSRQVRRIIVAADGGIREQTVAGLHEAGAETVVMGSLAFNAPDLAQRMAWIHSFQQAG